MAYAHNALGRSSSHQIVNQSRVLIQNYRFVARNGFLNSCATVIMICGFQDIEAKRITAVY
jgi:hypothetical protein